jgi:hypothetical protein
MPKSNKELAVELYCALIQSRSIIASQARGKIVSPTDEEAVAEVEVLVELLSKIKD